jgi:hypothetical protein
MKILVKVTTKSEVAEMVAFYDTCYFNEASPGPFWIRSKRQKTAMNRFAVALRRLKAVLNQKDLISTLRSAFPMNESDLADWCVRAENIAATPLPNRCRVNYAKRYAVQLTAEFLQCCDVELEKGPIVSSVALRKRSMATAKPNFITTAVSTCLKSKPGLKLSHN